MSAPITDGPHLTPDFLAQGIPFVSAEAIWDGRVHLEAKRGYISDADNANFSRKYSPEVGDIYVVKSGATTGKVAINDIAEPFNIWSPLAVVRCDRTKALPQFVFYALCSKQFQESVRVSWSIGTQPNIGMDVLENLKIMLPPLETQRIVAGFLDRETVRIDKLIAAKERLLMALAEKRQALITHAVTRGLQAGAPLRDSGVPWLGMMPAHWEVEKLKYIVVRIEQGTSPQCYNYPADKGEWGVLKTGCVNGGRFNENENKALPPDIEPELQYEVNEGDVLMSRASGSVDLIGSVAMVTSTPNARLQLSDKVFRLVVDTVEYDRAFFVLVMGSRCLRTQIQLAISGAEGLANNLPQSDICEFILPVPPKAEQTEIVKVTAEVLRNLDGLTVGANRTMDILRERRSALIAAAVTGQLAV